MDNPFATLVDPQKINEVIENTLLITLNPEKRNFFLISNENDNSEKFFTIELLEFVLFERVLSFDTEQNDNKVIIYLFDSFQRVQQEICKNNDVIEVLRKIESLIFRNISTLLKQPELASNQNLSSQFLEIFRDSDHNDNSERNKFLSSCISEALEDCDDQDMTKNVREIFNKCLDDCTKIVRQASMITLEKWVIAFLMAFVSDKNNSAMANILLDYTTPPENCDGIKYSDSLLGLYSF